SVKFTYVVTAADIAKGEIENTATAKGKDPNGKPVEDDDDYTVGTEDPEHPTDPEDPDKPVLYTAKIETVKEAAPGLYTVGDTITYTVTVENIGNVAVKNIQVTDNREGAKLAAGETGVIDTLAAGEKASVKFTYVVTAADIAKGEIINTATAKGEDPNGKPVEDDDTYTVGTEDPEDPTDPDDPDKPVLYTAKIETVKEAAPGLYTVGDTITYTVTVENIGNVAVKNIQVTDNREGAKLAAGETGVIDTLAAGEKASVKFTYVVTAADIAKGEIINTATAKGEDPNGKPVEDDDTYTVGTEDPEDPTDPDDPDKPVLYTAAIEIEKIADKMTDVKVGDVVTYTVTVKNTGNVPVKITEVSDTLVEIAPEDFDLQVILPGQTATAKYSFIADHAHVNHGSIENTVNVTTEDPNGDEVPGTDTVTVETADPETVDAEVRKTWADNNDEQKKRPGQITVHLFKDGVEIDSAVIKAADGWKHTFAGLQKYHDDGTEIEYTVTEDAVSGYVTRINGFNVTNTITTIPVHKVVVHYWYEEVGGDKAAPDSVHHYFEGEGYDIVSPYIQGYTPDLTRVTGVVGKSDIEVDVVYTPVLYSLTIRYIDRETGAEVATTYYESGLKVGDHYEVVSPKVAGKTPSIGTVKGSMPAHDMVVTVFYGTGTIIITDYETPLGAPGCGAETGECFE
ncbi:MAG: Cna B-type domain-containing protein, partial [Clostridia bacterium]|nr:Cna B-type domain-containing protein [Clostridia bacterium]